MTDDLFRELDTVVLARDVPEAGLQAEDFVWVTLGNVRNATLRAVVLRVWPRVADLLVAGEPLVGIG